MKKGLTAFISFTAGLLIGAVGGCYISKTKYEKIANDDIASAMEAFQEKIDELTKHENPVQDISDVIEPVQSYNSPKEYLNHHPEIDKPSYEKDEDDDAEHAERVKTLKKEADMAEKKYNKAVEGLSNASGPYVITPEQYGAEESYDIISMTLSKDGDLIDDRNKEIITDKTGLVGECLSEMGKYADDIIHVRNDLRMCDYEITKDLRSTEEIVEN